MRVCVGRAGRALPSTLGRRGSWERRGGGAAISYPCVVKHHLGEGRREKSLGVLSHRSFWPESQAHTGAIRGTCTMQSFHFGEAGAFRSKGVVLKDCW